MGRYCADFRVDWRVRYSRVLRSGDCGKEAKDARTAYRNSSVPGCNSPNIGFRLVRGAP
jgi:formylglycine-generating enzyme required for sulfatase activity